MSMVCSTKPQQRNPKKCGGHERYFTVLTVFTVQGEIDATEIFFKTRQKLKVKERGKPKDQSQSRVQLSSTFCSTNLPLASANMLQEQSII